MELITSEDRMPQLIEYFESLMAAVQRLRRRTEELLEQLEAGETLEKAGQCKELGELSGLIVRCHKAEHAIVNEQQKQAGIVQAGCAIDLEKARFEIGCRLARLREHQDTGRVPG